MKGGSRVNNVLKWITMVILAIGLIGAVIFGGIEVINLFKNMITTQFDLGVIENNLKNIAYTGGNLALIYLGYRALGDSKDGNDGLSL